MFVGLLNCLGILDGMAYDSERPLVILLDSGEPVDEYLQILFLGYTFLLLEWHELCKHIQLNLYKLELSSVPEIY